MMKNFTKAFDRIAIPTAAMILAVYAAGLVAQGAGLTAL